MSDNKKNNNNNNNNNNSNDNNDIKKKKKTKRKGSKRKNSLGKKNIVLDEPEISLQQTSLTSKKKNKRPKSARGRSRSKGSKSKRSSSKTGSLTSRSSLGSLNTSSSSEVKVNDTNHKRDRSGSLSVVSPSGVGHSANLWKSAVSHLHSNANISLSPLASKKHHKVEHIRDLKARLAVTDTNTYKQLRKELLHLERVEPHIPENEIDEFHAMKSILAERVLSLQSHIAINRHALKDIHSNAEKANKKHGGNDGKINKLHEHLTDAVAVAEEAMANFGQAKHKVERLETFQDQSTFFKHKHIVDRPRLRQFWKNGGRILVREDREHKVSWNELFFDLVFVVGVAHIGHDLEYNRNLRGLFEFGVLFAMLWRNWTALNVYINRFDPQDALHKVYYFIQMLSVMGMVSHVTRGVVYSYLLGRGSTEVMNIWAAVFEPKVRRAVVADLLVYLFASIPLLYSIIIIKENEKTKNEHPESSQLYAWVAALALELVGQLLIDFIPNIRIPVNIEHVTERFGLFTIIMLGEQVAAALFQSCEATFATYLAAIFAGVITITYQIFYFDVEAGKQRQHALLRHGWRPHIWFFIHLPLQAAITVVAVGMKLLIGDTYTTNISGGCHASGDAHHVIPFDRWIFCGGLCVCYLCFVCLGFLHHGLSTLVTKRIRMMTRLFCGVIIGVLPIFGSFFHPEVLLGVGAGLGIVAGSIEMYGGVVPKDSQLHNKKKIHRIRGDDKGIYSHLDK